MFSFVALWHDLTFRLLAWGWLVSLFVIPELAASYLLPVSKVFSLVYSPLTTLLIYSMLQFGKYPWYRHVCAMGGVLNIVMMMTANLVGFVVGTDGVKFLASQLSGTWDGARFMVLASISLFVGVQLMFEYRYVISAPIQRVKELTRDTREEELRQGIKRRC